MDNTKYFREALRDAVTLPQYFQANGYVTLRSGKQFHGGIDDQPSWTEGGEPQVPRVPRTPEQDAERRRNSDRIVPVEGDGENLGDARSAQRAIELLEKDRDRPFFMAVGFAKPHTPFQAPKKFIDLYDPAKIALPPDFSPEIRLSEGVPAGALGQNGDIFIQRPASEKEAREMIAGYYGCVSWMDSQVGRVLDALDRLRLRENTVIVFWGDHGFHLGEKGKWSKHNSLYEVGTRVPLIFSAPRHPPRPRSRPHGGTAGHVSDARRTLPPAEANRAGRSEPRAAPEGPHREMGPSRRHLRAQPAGGRAVGPHRTLPLHRLGGGRNGSELYDHETDPRESGNLAMDPKDAPVVEQMKRLLRTQ